MVNCLIGLGSNLGDRESCLDRAVEAIAANPDFTAVIRSRSYRAAPIGGPGEQEDYLNAALVGETSLSPQQLLAFLQQVENRLGRKRDRRWGARTVDLDLLLYDEITLNSPELILPHPRMAFRRFVLAPAVEVAPDMLHPTTGWTVQRLLEHLDTADNYVAMAGVAGTKKADLAKSIAEQTSSQWIADRVDTDDRIQQMLHRAKLLNRRLLPSQGDQSTFAVSDFWFEQSLVDARQSPVGCDLEAFEQSFHDACREVVSPKLLVLLEFSPISPAIEPRQTALLKQASMPDRGPVLRLDATDRTTAVVEVTAAIEAMRSVPQL